MVLCYSHYKCDTTQINKYISTVIWALVLTLSCISIDSSQLFILITENTDMLYILILSREEMIADPINSIQYKNLQFDYSITRFETDLFAKRPRFMISCVSFRMPTTKRKHGAQAHPPSKQLWCCITGISTNIWPWERLATESLEINLSFIKKQYHILP